MENVDLAIAKFEGVDTFVAVDGRNQLWYGIDGIALAFGIEYYKMLDFADGIWIDVEYQGDPHRMMKSQDVITAVKALAEKQLVTFALHELQFLNVPNTGHAPDTSSR